MFDLKIKGKEGPGNVFANHLSKLIMESQDVLLNNTFPDEHLLAIFAE